MTCINEASTAFRLLMTGRQQYFRSSPSASSIVIQRLRTGLRKRDLGVSSAGSGAPPSVSELLRELEALRGRLDQAQGWLRSPRDSMKARALAEEVKRLCQEASCSGEEGEVARSLTRARDLLNELHVLLGVH